MSAALVPPIGFNVSNNIPDRLNLFGGLVGNGDFGQGASPAGSENSRFVLAPQSGQLLGMPSEVREDMFTFDLERLTVRVPDAAPNEAEEVKQPQIIVTHRRLEVNPKASAAWMRRLSEHAVLVGTLRQECSLFFGV